MHLLQVLAVLFCWQVSAAESSAGSDRAQSACAMRNSVYDHPSMSCWRVYEAALYRGDYAAAFEAVRVGCDHYKRSDYCLFVRQWKVTPDAIRHARSSWERYNIRVAAELAGEMVTTAEIEDAEGPIHAQAVEVARQKNGAPSVSQQQRTATRHVVSRPKAR